MKKTILILSLLLVVLATFAFVQFPERWKKVEKHINNQLPESAMKEVDQILEEAKKADNFNETLKAYIHKMRLTIEKDPDQAPNLLKEFESFAKPYANPAQKALLHSMTAELYAMYYQAEQYAINQRTQMIGFTPDNVNEWSKNLFFDKISEEIKLSLEDTQTLQNESPEQFALLLEKGKDSAELQPALYDFLASRAVNILSRISEASTIKNPLNHKMYFAPIDDFLHFEGESAFDGSAENEIIKIYQQYLSFRKKENQPAAFIYTELNRINYLHNNSEHVQSDELYFNALENLYKAYPENEAIIPVMEAMADYYLSQEHNTSGAEDNFRKKAYEITEKGIRAFPSVENTNSLRNLQAQITQKTINVNFPAITAPSSLLEFEINSANIKEIELKVYRINATAKEYHLFTMNKDDYEIKLHPKNTLLETKKLIVEVNENFDEVKSKISITPKEYGIYEFIIAEKGNDLAIEQAHGTFTVSDFAFINRTVSEKNPNTYIINRVSGKPIGNVDVQLAYAHWDGGKYSLKDIGQTKSDKNGFFSFNTSRYTSEYFLSKGEDKYFCSAANNYYRREYPPTETTVMSMFTDRSLYRPGQTLYFKGIAFSSQKQEVVKKGTKYEVRLLDANWQEVSKKTFTTNEFGSISGEFVLPESGLNGSYQLQTSIGSISFFVEEYKRPTFELSIEKPETEVYFDKAITFKGNAKAYAGYAIPNAQVKYSIVRRTHRLFWWWHTPEKIVDTGVAATDEKGNFTITFVPERTNSKNSFFREQFYTYTLEANVTDTKGETQQGTQSVSVGDKSLFIVADVPEMHDKQKELEIILQTETLNGKSIASLVKYSLYEMENTDIYKEKLNDKSILKEKKQILSGTFNTDDKQLKINTGKLNSGYYKIIFTTPDAQGKEVKSESVFVLYNVNDKRPPVKSYVWMQNVKTTFAPEEKAEIHFGTSAENTHVLYEIMRGNTVLESKWIVLNNEIQKIEIPYKNSYGDGVNVLFTFVKDEQLFDKSITISKKTENKTLTPALSTFRDKLLPGEKSEWTVTIPETADEKRIAELMIGMYDASLDAIRPHSWMFYPNYNLNIPYSPSWTINGLKKQHSSAYYSTNYADAGSIELNRLNWFGLNMRRHYYGYFGGGGGRKNSLKMRSMSKEEMLIEESADMELFMVEAEAAPPAPSAKEDGLMLQGNSMDTSGHTDSGKTVQVRSNFNETAFFYPQLKTDKNGNIKFSFTVPESLTRWNVKMLTHTPDLYFGQNETQVVTQKDLMVQLNMPRFIRRSDKLTLVANLINLTENELTANVKFELINPDDEKTIKLMDYKDRIVSLAANETKAVEWQITEFSDYELVVAKVTAQAGSFSDGEQHYLPVLPDKVLLTESMPLTIRSNQTRDFKFESLIKQAKDLDSKSLTIEFSPNPTWYAVQALPTLSAPTSENAIDYFSAYYVNGLASHIANSNPKIKSIFDRWKNEEGSREALLSNLEKNTELKNMLLEETPWVMAAKDETEQKKQIALLFDLNMQANNAQQYLDKILQLQLPSGGFAWFEGMQESRYITHTILLNMARFNKMTNTKNSNQAWIVNALNYIDLQIAKDYDYLKKHVPNYKNKMQISDTQWFYLHARSEYKHIPIHTSAKEAVEFYTAQAEKYWKEATLYGKAATALISYRNGKTNLANDILKSLKENAMKSDEMGMYWARNTAGYFWNERPISVHTAILEAFAEVGKNKTDLDEMKIWLLKQKQTQRWDSPLSTADAIYALLNYGTDWLANEGAVEIKLNNKVLEPQSKEAGTGYFKESISANNIDPKMGNVTVKKSGDGIGWGALYWQYYQDVDKVQAHGGALSVTKKLFVERKENNKNVMLPVEQLELKKGDKVIIRLVVSTDRNLEFVALKDLRAACFEPVDQRSGMVWREGVAYYETTKDASTQFFFNFLPKGNYVFEYEVWVNNTGEFANGMTSIQCLYAPEFVSHSGSGRVKVK